MPDKRKDIRLLWFNLATDADDPILGFTTSWIRAVAERIQFIHVITMRAGRVDVPGNVRVYSVGKEKGYSEPRRAIQFYRHLFDVLRQDKIDVCFSHMIPIFTVLAAPVLKLKGIPILTWYAHPSLTWTLKLSHHLSDRIMTSLSMAYPYKHDNKLMVIGQGINTDLFFPSNGMPSDDPPMILCASRLSPVKDHTTLLKATWLLSQHYGKRLRVVVLGDPAGPQDEDYVLSLREQVKGLGLEDMVKFEPAVPITNLPSWYRRCTIHVNLTPTGSGDKVAWEAMACGRPCLVANEGFRETLGEYADTLWFRYRNPEDLSEKLAVLLELSSPERRRMGFYLRDQVLRLHSLERLAERLVSLFCEVRSCLR